MKPDLEGIWQTVWQVEVELRAHLEPGQEPSEEARAAAIKNAIVEDYQQQITKRYFGFIRVRRARKPEDLVVFIGTEDGQPNFDAPSSFILHIMMKGDLASDAAANLEDLYPGWLEKYGNRRARWIFRAQVVHVLAGYWWGKVRSVIESVKGLIQFGA